MPQQPKSHSKTGESIQITLSIQECRCTYFALSEYGLRNTIPVAPDQFEFGLILNFNADYSTKQVRINFSSKILEKKGDQGKNELCEIHATCLFTVVNFESLIKKEEPAGKFNISGPLLEICNSITINSVRGILAVKLENTLYSNAVLPLIDVKVLKPVSATTPTAG